MRASECVAGLASPILLFEVIMPGSKHSYVLTGGISQTDIHGASFLHPRWVFRRLRQKLDSVRRSCDQVEEKV